MPEETTCPIPLITRRGQPHAPPHALPRGSVVADRYVIEGHIGLGGSAAVYRASHRVLEYPVALKVGLQKGGDSMRRFRRESRALSRIDNPHVVRVTDLGELPAGFPFCAMHLLEGQTLERRLDERGRLDFAEALSLARQLCEGLRAVHRTGLVHRDVKPGNLVLTTGDDGEDVLVLVDFGIVKPLLGSRLTLPGLTLGTPGYMAPEQIALGAVDTRADIYSAGAVLYEMIAGRPPYEAETLPALFELARCGMMEPVERHRPDCPPVISSILARALAESPADRFPTARLMDEALALAEKQIAPAASDVSLRLCA